MQVIESSYTHILNNGVGDLIIDMSHEPLEYRGKNNTDDNCDEYMRERGKVHVSAGNDSINAASDQDRYIECQYNGNCSQRKREENQRHVRTYLQQDPFQDLRLLCSQGAGRRFFVSFHDAASFANSCSDICDAQISLYVLHFRISSL